MTDFELNRLIQGAAFNIRAKFLSKIVTDTEVYILAECGSHMVIVDSQHAYTEQTVTLVDPYRRRYKKGDVVEYSCCACLVETDENRDGVVGVVDNRGVHLDITSDKLTLLLSEKQIRKEARNGK